MEPSQHPHQYPVMYPLEDPEDMLTDDEDELLQGRKKEKEKYNEHERNLIAIAPSATRRKEKPRVCHEISLIGVNDIIGISLRFIKDNVRVKLSNSITCNNGKSSCLI